MPVYLDNASTTKPCAEAVEAVKHALTENYGNPSSLHRVGLYAQLAVDRARKITARSIGAGADSIIFTSGATESNNLAVRGACRAYGRKKKRIVCSSVEHPSVKKTVLDMEKEGFEVIFIKPSHGGRFEPKDFVQACNSETVLITMMYVNNETGYILPVEEVFGEVKKKFPEIITHSDCVQAYMKLPFTARKLNADLISLSGHKIEAVKGCGVLFVRDGVRLIPQMTGGNQERGLRSGTESVPLISAFGASVKKMSDDIDERLEKVNNLKSYLLEKISDIEGVQINSPDDGLPYIISISQPKRSEIMLHYLESKDIYVSSGSACSRGKQSGVAEQFGITGRRADGILRVSITADTKESEIDLFAEVLREGIENIRG